MLVATSTDSTAAWLFGRRDGSFERPDTGESIELVTQLDGRQCPSGGQGSVSRGRIAICTLERNANQGAFYSPTIDATAAASLGLSVEAT
jgi:hypothetical protein